MDKALSKRDWTQSWHCLGWVLDPSPQTLFLKDTSQQEGNPVHFCHLDSNPWYLKYRLNDFGITVKYHFFLLKINEILRSSVGKVCSFQVHWERLSLSLVLLNLTPLKSILYCLVVFLKVHLASPGVTGSFQTLSLWLWLLAPVVC